MSIQALLAAAKANEAKSTQPGVESGALTIEQLTFGPDENNLGGKYVHGPGAWDLKFVDKISPDIMLLFASRMAQVYKRVNHTNVTPPIDRKVKDILLKERYPVHQLDQVLG